MGDRDVDRVGRDIDGERAGHRLVDGQRRLRAVGREVVAGVARCAGVIGDGDVFQRKRAGVGDHVGVLDRARQRREDVAVGRVTRGLDDLDVGQLWRHVLVVGLAVRQLGDADLCVVDLRGGRRVGVDRHVVHDRDRGIAGHEDREFPGQGASVGRDGGLVGAECRGGAHLGLGATGDVGLPDRQLVGDDRVRDRAIHDFRIKQEGHGLVRFDEVVVGALDDVDLGALDRLAGFRRRGVDARVIEDGRVRDEPALVAIADGRRCHDVDRRRRVGCQVAREAQDVADEAPTGVGGLDRPREVAVERVGDGDIEGGPVAVVTDGDREADLVADEDRIDVIRVLVDPQVGAVDHDRGAVCVVPRGIVRLIRGVDRHGVHERTAVVEIGVAGDRDRDLAVRSQVAQVRAGQRDSADRAQSVGIRDLDAVIRDGVEVPGDAAREGVGEADVIRRARTDVGDDDGERGFLAGADAGIHGRLDDLEIGAVDDDLGARAVVVGHGLVVRLVGRIDRDRVRDGRAVGRIGGADDVDRRRGAGGQVGRAEAQHARVDGPAVGGTIDGPVDAGRQGVGAGGAIGGAGPVVLDGDREADLVTGVDRRGIGDLEGLDVRAADIDGCTVRVPAVVTGAHDGGVVDRSAVRSVGDAFDVDREAGATREGVPGAGQDLGAEGTTDRAACDVRVDRPVDARGEVVGDGDVVGRAIAAVAHDDVEADCVARIDRSDRVGGLLDVDDGAQDVDVTRVRVVAVGSSRLVGGRDVRQVRDDVAVPARGGRAERDRPGRVVGERAEVARQDIGVRSGVDGAVGGVRATERPRVAGGQVVGQGHTRGRARTEVRDDDGERGRLARIHGAAIRGLGHGDIRAQDRDLARIGVRAVVVGGDLARVVDLRAGRGGGRAGERDRAVDGRGGREVRVTGDRADVAGQDVSRAEQTGGAGPGGTADAPVQAAGRGHRVADDDARGAAFTLVGPAQREADVRAGRDRAVVRRLDDLDVGRDDPEAFGRVVRVLAREVLGARGGGVLHAEAVPTEGRGRERIRGGRLVVDIHGATDLGATVRAVGLGLAGAADEEFGCTVDLAVRATERGHVDDRLALVDARDVLPALLDMGFDVRRNAGVEAAEREVLELRVGLLRRAGLSQERAEARRLATEHVAQVDSAFEELAGREVRLAVLVHEGPWRVRGVCVRDCADVEGAIGDVARGAGRDEVQVAAVGRGIAVPGVRDVVAAAGAFPFVGADQVDDAAVRVFAEDQDVAVDVVAGEVAVGDPDVALEEPEPDLGVAVVIEAIGAEVDPRLAVLLIDGGVGVEELVLVGDRVGRDGPARDVVLVLGAAAGEVGAVVRGGFARGAGEEAVEGAFRPVLPVGARGAGVVGVAVELEDALVMGSEGRCWRGQLHGLESQREQEQRGPQQSQALACPRVHRKPKSPRHRQFPSRSPDRLRRSVDTRRSPLVRRLERRSRLSCARPARMMAAVPDRSVPPAEVPGNHRTSARHPRQ